MAKGDNLRSSELLGVLNQVSSALNNSPSNIYINPSVLRDILSLDKELSSVLNDLNLTHDQRSRQLVQRLVSCSNEKLRCISPKNSTALSISPSNSKFHSAIEESSESSESEEENSDVEEDSDSSSSISLYSTDSISADEYEEEPKHHKKGNLIIRCNLNSGSEPNKNVIHVFRQDPACVSTCPGPCAPRDRSQSNAKKKKEKKEKERLQKEQKLKEKEKKQKDKEQKEKAKKEKLEKDKKAKLEKLEKAKKDKLEKQEKAKKDKLEKQKQAKEKKQKPPKAKKGDSDGKKKKEPKKKPKKGESAESSASESPAKAAPTPASASPSGPAPAQAPAPTPTSTPASAPSTTPVSSPASAASSTPAVSKAPAEKAPPAVKSPAPVGTTPSASPSKPPPASTPAAKPKGIIQCDISPKCWFRCKSTQAAHTRKTPPVCQSAAEPPSPCDLESPCRSRIAKFLSSFGNGGIQLRFIPPEKKCRSVKSCIIPKLCLPRTITVDSSSGIPRIRFSRTCEPCNVQLPCSPPPAVRPCVRPPSAPCFSPPPCSNPECNPPPCSKPPPCSTPPCNPPPCSKPPSNPPPCNKPPSNPSPCSKPPCNPPPCNPPPCNPPPCNPPPCNPPPCNPPPCNPPPCRPPPAKSMPCVPLAQEQPPPCSKLPACVRRPSFPRLKPCVIPSSRFKPTCKIRSATCENRPCTPPPPIPRLSGPRSHTPPPCSSSPCGPFFPPHSNSVSDCIPCSETPSCYSKPPCASKPKTPCRRISKCRIALESKFKPTCLPGPCTPPPICTPKPCSSCVSAVCIAKKSPCIPPPCCMRPCTPPCNSEPCRKRSTTPPCQTCGKRPCDPPCPTCGMRPCSSPCQTCGPRPCTPPCDTCRPRPCSSPCQSCGSRPCTPPPKTCIPRPCSSPCQTCGSRPCTPPPKPCPPRPCTSPCPTCGSRPCTPPPCTPPCSLPPCRQSPCPSKSCFAKPCRMSCDSQCDMRKWTCCTKRNRPSRKCSPQPSCSRVTICEPCREPVSCPRRKPNICPAFYPQPCDQTPRSSDTNISFRRGPCVPRKCYAVPYCWKPCGSKEYLRSPSSDSDICYPRSPCRSRRCCVSPVCSKEDACYMRRKKEKPWWISNDGSRPCSPKSCSRPPSSCILEEITDQDNPCRKMYRIRRLQSSDDEGCYPKRCYGPPRWCWDSPPCSVENLCYRIPCLPRECVSIPCTSLPCSPRPCSPPRKALSCTPQPCRPRCPPPCPPPPTCMPPPQPCPPPPRPCLPPPPPCPPPPQYPPPCPPQYPPYMPPCPPPCFPPPCPPYPSPPTPSGGSMMSCGRNPGPQYCGPTACNPNKIPPCSIPPPPKQKCRKGPPCLKKMPKPCYGKPCGKRCFPDPPPACPPPCAPQPSSPPPTSPCASPIPSNGNVGYSSYPTPSGSSYGSNYWPSPASSSSPPPSPSPPYPPYGCWPYCYGGYPTCYPSQTYGGPGAKRPFPKVSFSKLKCSRICHMSCEPGLPRFDNSRSSSVSSVSSCSSSDSSLSTSSGSSYSSGSSSSSSSTSFSSPNYCVASCTNSTTNCFTSRCKPSNSSICSSIECCQRPTNCCKKTRFCPNIMPCGPIRPCNSSPRLDRRNSDTNQHTCGPSRSCKFPVHCARSQVCSSAADFHCDSTLRCRGIEHYDERIKFELQKIGINQLLQASKPAKCCKQTTLNQPSKEELPYSASLASLPLDRADIRVIRQSVRMATKKTDCNCCTSVENRTKLVYYANLVIDDFDSKKPKVKPEYEVRYFYFTLKDPENTQETLKKSYSKVNTFKFFQILNSSGTTSNGFNKYDSLENIDFTTSLDLKKFINSQEVDEMPLVVSSGENSTDILENIVFSDLLLVHASGVGDNNQCHKLNKHVEKEQKTEGKLKRNFTMTDSSLDSDSLYGENRNIERFCCMSPLGYLEKAAKTDAFSQTLITIPPGKMMFYDAASQTNNKNGLTFAEEIINLLSSSEEDSLEYQNKNRRFLEKKATLESDSLEVHLISELEKAKTALLDHDDEKINNVTQHLDDAMNQIFGEIHALATTTKIAENKNLRIQELNSKDYTIRSTIYSACSPQTLLKRCPSPMKRSRFNGNGETRMIAQKESTIHKVRSLRKQVSKGQFIVRMYNSINEVIADIYREAHRLATLRKNQLAISGKGDVFKDDITDRRCEQVTRFPSIVNTSQKYDKDLLKQRAGNLGESLDNLRTIYTTDGKIITKFFNAKGGVLNALYTTEGARIMESSSPRKLARLLFDYSGNYVPKFCDSRGKIIEAVYDSQRKLLEKTLNSEMLLMNFPPEKWRKKTEAIYNAQGSPINQFYSENGKLLTSIYDFEGRLIRGTFLGSITQMFPRIFDRQGKFILGRYNREGNIIKRIFDSQGYNLQQLYNSNKSSLQKTPIQLRILNQDGKHVRKFFNRNNVPLTHVYDVLGNLLCRTCDGNCKDLVGRLFDLDGFFILGRLDELMHLIDGVYDENGNRIVQVNVVDSAKDETSKINRFYNLNGKLLVNFFDQDGKNLKSVHDVKGVLLESSPSGRAVKLAGRMFDIAGHFIHGRYDGKHDIIKAIYDHDGNKIYQVYDVHGNPVRKIQQTSRIFDISGKTIKHFYRSDHKIVSSIYDINGDMVGGVSSLDADNIAPFLYDLEGKFINSRYDSRMTPIKRVYDSKENFLSRVYTQRSLGMISSKHKPVKTVYVKLRSKGEPIDKLAGGEASYNTHCQTLPKSIMPRLTAVKVPFKPSKLEVLKKRKIMDGWFDGSKQFVSIKCQCKLREKNCSGSSAHQVLRQKLKIPMHKHVSGQLKAKKSRTEKKDLKKVPKKSEKMIRSRTESHYDQRKISPKKPQRKETVLPCYETARTHVQTTNDSLENLLDHYLKRGASREVKRKISPKKMELKPAVEIKLDEDQPDSSTTNQTAEKTSNITAFSESSEKTSTTDTPQNKDAFLCNLPNAPPFILKMNKASASTVHNPQGREQSKSPLNWSTTNDSFDVDNTSAILSNSEEAGSTYTEIQDLNVFIDGNCPGFDDEAFNEFVTKSITMIKAEDEKRWMKPNGVFTSAPIICMAGLTGTSNNPFGTDEIDSRRPGKNMDASSSQYQSKIPKMLHPAKYKVHAKMKNVQLPPGSKGCSANRGNACKGPCPAGKTDIQISPCVKVSVSTTCPSLTNSSAAGMKVIQASKPASGDCMKGIRSDPGCYCGNEPVDTTPCPIRLREDCECVEEETAAQTGEPEEEDPLCYCPPGEQPLLLKKSNIECDCANRRRCEDNRLVDPPKEKPDVFWALTKVSLRKDGTKNFEIIDVSPVPPGYYLMPDVNNLVLVGPQPKPAKATPSKNCCCK